MFLVVHASGKYWDGLGWNVQGKLFRSPAQATRSLHEEGEDLSEAAILPIEFANKLEKTSDTTEEFSIRDFEAGRT